ncbi:MAG: thioredoxin family protein [Verrucomicrobiales bacterium]|nr:thioredoxin family protein [Verrucomicrobiales bacterium]
MGLFRSTIAGLCLLTLLALPGFAAPKVEPIVAGTAAPDFALPGIDGKVHKLADYASADVLAILFTCNHCPSAQAVEKRVIEMVESYKDQSFQLVAISPNSPAAIRINELGYSVYGDTLEDMKHHAKQRGFNFPFLYDGDTQQVSKAYGALATPHIFIFDKQRILQYNGRIDDSKYADESLIKSHDGSAAIRETRPG